MIQDRIRPQPFAFQPDVIDDLKARLERYRAPPKPRVDGWAMGIELEYLENLLQHWREDFDWSAAEKAINTVPLYRASVDTIDGGTIALNTAITDNAGSGNRALLMCSGWPSSFFEFHKIANRLAHPEQFGGTRAEALDIIIVDLPGFGLSDQPPKPMNHREMAALLKQVMVDILGYDQFIMHGGDWGAVTGSWLALDYPQHVTGLHLSQLGLKPALTEGKPLDGDEKAWLGAVKKALLQDSGYRETQSTKPNTLNVGLSDSPAALLAWLTEKYLGWSGGADAAMQIAADEILTSASLYWSTNNLPTANWLYWADRQHGDIGLTEGERVETPTGLAQFGNGFFPPAPTAWAERAYNIVHRTDFADGGHFPAWLAPDNFVAAISSFIKSGHCG